MPRQSLATREAKLFAKIRLAYTNNATQNSPLSRESGEPVVTENDFITWYAAKATELKTRPNLPPELIKYLAYMNFLLSNRR